jgi:hypothetical protein
MDILFTERFPARSGQFGIGLGQGYTLHKTI